MDQILYYTNESFENEEGNRIYYKKYYIRVKNLGYIPIKLDKSMAKLLEANGYVKEKESI